MFHYRLAAICFAFLIGFVSFGQLNSQSPSERLHNTQKRGVDIYLPAVVGSGDNRGQQGPTPTPSATSEPDATPTPRPTRTLPPGANFYVSPAGDDSKSGTSPAEAWATFSRAWLDVAPGDTLILMDGIYYQTLMPDQTSGEPDAPITIRAQNDGKAIIDGEYERIPVQLGLWPNSYLGNYVVIEGIVARNSSETVYLIMGDHNILRRVSGYNANKDRNSHIFTIAESEYNLLEDCIASGSGRKMAFSWGGSHNIIRRCFTNWTQYDAREFGGEWPWGEDLEFYNSSDGIIENSISYGTAPKTAVSVLGNINSANGSTPYSHDNQILGVISIRNGVFRDGAIQRWPLTRPQPTDSDIVSRYREWAGWRLGFGVILWGEEADVHDILFQDIFSWNNAGLGFAEIAPYNPSTNMTIRRATIKENGLDAPIGDGGRGTNVQYDQIEHYAITDSVIEGTQHQSGGARLEYRYVDGVLMDGSNGQPAQPLWPWPMQDRVLTEMGIDVTGEIVEILQQEGVPTGATLLPPLISPAPPRGNPVRNIAGATYIAPVEVTISTPIAGAVIRYTTDGSEPTTDSTQYAAPFTVNTSALVKARVFLGSEFSHSRSAYYVIDPAKQNEPPVVEAALMPFVYPIMEIMLPTDQVDLYATAEDFTLPTSSSKLTTQWSVTSGPAGVTFANPASLRTTAFFTQPGTYILRLTASDGALEATSDVRVSVLPKGGNVVSLPGRVEAENYMAGGEGVAYHDTSAGNFAQIYRLDDVDLEIAYNEGYGYSVYSMRPGEWMAYRVNVTQAGSYRLDVRTAAVADGGTFHVELDGQDISGPIAFEYTSGGLRRWKTLSVQTPTLAAGSHQLRIVVDAAAPGREDLPGTINYLEFVLP